MMHAYLRADGMYDTYDVEPKVITAAAYEKYVRVENLKAKEAELKGELAKVQADLAAEESETIVTTPTEVARKRW